MLVVAWMVLGRPLAVILIVGGSLLLARFLRRWVKGRWYWPAVWTALACWVALPTAVAAFNPGYYVENGMVGQELTDPFFHKEAGAPARAAEICGDADGFDIKDPTLRYVYMPVQKQLRHFFHFSSYSNIVWAGVGWKERYCLAKYRVTVHRTRQLFPIPVRIFPYPYFGWNDGVDVDYKLLERLPLVRPPAPEGVKVLFPGECWAGKIGTGETLKFQVEMPEAGPENELHLYTDCDHLAAYRWTRNGVPIDGKADKQGGKATYRIELEGPSPRPQGYAIPYRVGVYWGEGPGCRLKRWDERCPEKTVEKP